MSRLAGAVAGPEILREARGLGLVALASLLWSTVGVAQQLMSAPEAVPPAAIGLFRVVIGGAVLIACVALVEPPRTRRLPVPWRGLLAFGLGGAVFQVTLFEAFRTVGVTVTVVVTIVLPPVLAVAIEGVRRRTVGVPIAAAVAVATVGTALALGGRGDPGPLSRFDPWSAGALFAANALAFLMMVDGLGRLKQVMSPMRAAGTGLLVVAAALLPLVLATAPTGSLAAIAGMTPRDVLLVVYMGSIATGGAYVAFATGLSCCRSALAGITATMVEPLFACLFAALLLGELPSAVQATGCLILLAAMALVFRAERGAPSAA